MLTVVDVNVVFSSLIRTGIPFRVFDLNNEKQFFEFIAPEYLFTEIGKRMDRILTITDSSNEELIKTFSLIKNQIKIIPTEIFQEKYAGAKKKAPHDKDAPYVALALKFDCKIFSGDKGLKNALPEMVLNPSEILDMLSGENK